ncbi:MAG TPA: phosphate signaling complex protein PhoU [Phycisphaerales bacterium]|nr:phosphate signaling complex protein PhoU [Phycisphaerales bacterium]
MDSTQPARTEPATVHEGPTSRRVEALKRRLIREGTTAVSMLEAAVAALRTLDVEGASAVRRSDDQVDFEEIAIEQECYALLSLHHPYAHDFRTITFALRANADLERIADHASSLAKIVGRVVNGAGMASPPRWPTALLDLCERVPQNCHALLRAVQDEDVDAALRLVATDQTIDQLEKQLFKEVQEMIDAMGRDDTAVLIGMLVYRAGRELERIGDLTASIAEDLVYLARGDIIRHAKRRAPSPA